MSPKVMKEIFNSIGTVVTLTALILAAFLVPNIVVRILCGIGIVYTMIIHDQYLVSVANDDEVDEYNAWIDKYNKKVDEENGE